MTMSIARRDQPAGGLDVRQLGELLAGSGYFKDVKDVAQAAVKVLAGQELGIGPATAMTAIHIVQGKPTLSAGLMATLVKRSGRYNYRVLERSPAVCRIQFYERWDGKWEPVGEASFTIDEAKAAKLTDKDTWRAYAADMLFARAMARGTRTYCPDVLGGPVYDPDELDSAPSLPPLAGMVVDEATGEVVDEAFDGAAALAAVVRELGADRREAWRVSGLKKSDLGDPARVAEGIGLVRAWHEAMGAPEESEAGVLDSAWEKTGAVGAPGVDPDQVS